MRFSAISAAVIGTAALAAAAPTSILEDNLTWNIYVDYTRCDSPSTLSASIHDNWNGSDYTPIANPVDGVQRFPVLAPFNGSLTLSDSAADPPTYDPQFVLIELYTAAGVPAGNTVWGKATFVSGAQTRPLDYLTWSRKSADQQSLRPASGEFGTLATGSWPDDLFVYYCYTPENAA